MVCQFGETLTSTCPRSAIMYKQWISRSLIRGTREQNDALSDFVRWIFNGSFSGADNCVKFIFSPVYDALPSMNKTAGACTYLLPPF